MHNVITYLLSTILLIAVMFTMAQRGLGIFADVTDTWIMFEDRTDQNRKTRLTGPVGLTADKAGPVYITLVNEGDVALGDFDNWDVIFEIQEASGFDINYLEYTELVPGADRWTVDGIYLDTTPLTSEYIDPGILNPGEKMVIRANPSASMVENTVDRAVFVTPDGFKTEVIFEVIP